MKYMEDSYEWQYVGNEECSLLSMVVNHIFSRALKH